jgi:hypothetical protein
MKIAGSFKVSGITKTGTSLNLIFSKNKNNHETLPIINKPKHPEKKGGGNASNKMEGSMSKKTKEPSKRWNHKGNIKLLSPLLSQEAYQIRKGVNLLKGRLT